MKIYFLTYGDRKFYLSKKHLIELAKKSDMFDHCISLGFNDLDLKFKKNYEEILKQKRGGGYWIWKPRIIQSLINEIKENDIVVYCDAGASLNFRPTAKKRFNEYIELLNSSHYGNFRMYCEEGFIEKNYTIKEIFNYFDISTDSNIANSLQLQAGHMIFQKNSHTLEYFQKFEKILQYDQHLISDIYNKSNQLNTFVENRHDQSIFSLLSKKFGSVIIDNETEFKKRPTEQYSYPFLSVRRYGHGVKDYLRFLFNYKNATKNTLYFE